MNYGKSHRVNCETGEIEEVNLTPEEVIQRDKERAEAEAKVNIPAPPSEVEQLKELVSRLSQRVNDLEEGKLK